MIRSLSLALTVVLPACSFSSDFGGTRFLCESNNDCPPDQVCVVDHCEPPSAPQIDAGDRDGNVGIDGGGPIVIDPTLATWDDTTPLPGVRDYNYQHAAFVEDTIYLVGGYDWTIPDERTTVYAATVNADGTVDEWDEANALPGARANGDVVVTDTHVYVVGGSVGGTAQNSVYVAEIEDGALGAWNEINNLPLPRKAHVAVSSGDHLYAIGGLDNTNAVAKTVYRAPIQANGNLGAWTPTSELPEARASAAGVFADGVIYLIGGENPIDTGHATVYYARVEEDGELSSWDITGELPSARWSATAELRGGYVYLFGGLIPGITAQVLHARLGDVGGLEDWETNTGLPAGRSRHASVVAGDYFYVIGGIGETDTVYFTRLAEP